MIILRRASLIIVKNKIKDSFKYSNEAYDFVTDLVRLKNVVIKAQQQEIIHLRNILTRRV